MFRIRRVFDDVLPVNQRDVAQVQEILRVRFPRIEPREVADLPAKLRDPVKYKSRTYLFVADDARGNVRGFAILSHDPALRFAFLDNIATAKGVLGGGIGGALYQHVREESRLLGVIGLFFECLPDDPVDCSPEILKENVARLRFYERFGARPIINNEYRLPFEPGRAMPYLCFDGLDTDRLPRRSEIRKIVRAYLERTCSHLVWPAYIDRVVASFKSDPVQLREFRYVKARSTGATTSPSSLVRPDQRIKLIVNDRHDIHHVRDRGYVEAPVRIRMILDSIEPTGHFQRIQPREFAESHIRAVHDGHYVDYFKRICSDIAPNKSIYPYVFPLRNATRRPTDLAARAGYYCIDTFTPFNKNAYLAAKRAVDCTLTAADALLKGDRLAYALVRPPGHHAERRVIGGFCYFNNAAVAAQYLSAHGRVAILDVDYHHGNGQQDIFYSRGDVLTVSIHGHPRFAYPFFSGFEDETGAGPGEGCNVNHPLPEGIDGPRFRETLKRALDRIVAFRPVILIVALGLDPAKGDPTGTWKLTPDDFEQNGRMIGSLSLPTLVVQEGGYRTRTLGLNAAQFFAGLHESAFGAQKLNGGPNWKTRPPAK